MWMVLCFAPHANMKLSFLTYHRAPLSFVVVDIIILKFSLVFLCLSPLSIQNDWFHRSPHRIHIKYLPLQFTEFSIVMLRLSVSIWTKIYRLTVGACLIGNRKIRVRLKPATHSMGARNPVLRSSSYYEHWFKVWLRMIPMIVQAF